MSCSSPNSPAPFFGLVSGDSPLDSEHIGVTWPYAYFDVLSFSEPSSWMAPVLGLSMVNELMPEEVDLKRVLGVGMMEQGISVWTHFGARIMCRCKYRCLLPSGPEAVSKERVPMSLQSWPL